MTSPLSLLAGQVISLVRELLFTHTPLCHFIQPISHVQEIDYSVTHL